MNPSARRTVRTVFQGVLAFAALAPLLVATVSEAFGSDLSLVPFVATGLALLAAVTKVMNLTPVELFLREYVPFLARQTQGEIEEFEAELNDDLDDDDEPRHRL